MTTFALLRCMVVVVLVVFKPLLTLRCMMGCMMFHSLR
jgi:hypothetical protein